MNLQNDISSHNRLNLKKFFLIAFCFCINANSKAATFDCTTDPGFCIAESDSIMFRFTGTSSSLGLFGDIEVIGNNIVTFPTDFRAESLNGALTVSVNDNRNIQITAKPGYRIDSINILERGDYLMSGTGNTIDVDGWFDIWDLNNPVFGPTDTQILSISDDLTTIDSNIHTWTGTASFDLTGPAWDGVNQLNLNIQNNLYATTYNHGDIAWVEKKIAGVNFVVTQVPVSSVPVPSAVWLFGSGLLGLVGLARRKQKV